MSGTGIASTRAGKKKVIDEVSDLLNKCSLVFSVPSAGIKVGFILASSRVMKCFLSLVLPCVVCYIWCHWLVTRCGMKK